MGQKKKEEFSFIAVSLSLSLSATLIPRSAQTVVETKVASRSVSFSFPHSLTELNRGCNVCKIQCPSKASGALGRTLLLAGNFRGTL